MTTRRSPRFVVLTLLCICVVGIVYFREQLIRLTYETASFEATPNDLKIIDASEFANETGFQCLKANIATLSFPICVYEAKDDTIVSKLFYSGNYYEKDLVAKFLKLLKTQEDVTFVDLGANIGVYSLPVSHLGRHVVAVEANPETYRRLAKSIHLGGVSSHVDVINYALADVGQTEAVLQINMQNRGASFLTKTISCGPDCSVTVPATTLDRLLPLVKNRKVVMKADVERSEINIFTETGAAKFFQSVDVSFIMMEWDLYTRYYTKDEESRNMVNRFVQFFFKRGYDVYDPKKGTKLSLDWMKWPYLVVFKKQGLPTDELFSL